LVTTFAAGEQATVRLDASALCPSVGDGVVESALRFADSVRASPWAAGSQLCKVWERLDQVRRVHMG
jgi:hypothetical protein